MKKWMKWGYYTGRKRGAVRDIVRTCAVVYLALCVGFVGCGRVEKTPAAGSDDKAATDEESCPESLKKLAETNPEAEDFVKDYAKNKGKKKKIDISGDLTGGIPLFLQWDKRWGYRKYGGEFIAVNGCGPTCLSMVWCGLTGKTKWNPYKVAKMAEEKGYYVKGTGSTWNLMTEGAMELGLCVENVVFDKEHIVDTLKKGRPIICVVGPGDFTTQGHFLVLTGVTSHGKIKIHDPNSKKNSERKWKLSELMPQIKNLWAYRLR